jgi:hypothetical protein
MKPACNLQPFYTSIFLFREDRIRGQKGPTEVQVLFWFTDNSGENMELNVGGGGSEGGIFSPGTLRDG